MLMTSGREDVGVMAVHRGVFPKVLYKGPVSPESFCVSAS